VKASVLIVDDDDSLRHALADRFRFWGHTIEEAEDGLQAVEEARAKAFDLILLDLSMPRMTGLEVLDALAEIGSEAAVVVLSAHGSVERVVEAMRRGAADFLPKPADFDLLQSVVNRVLDSRRLKRVNQALTDCGASPLIVGESPAMRELVETANRAADSDATLLLIGESGTGKQVLAEHIHRMSPRESGPFVHVNCVAISDELIESTLFGHEKGAFTGAVGRKVGRLETAAGGTAFLDEVGDISPRLQTKLLHFLESGCFERVGGNRTIGVDCRIVSATNRDLRKEVREGRFREDLYYRLNVITLEIPPLADRREDIPILADAFLSRFRAELNRENLAFAPETVKSLGTQPWPGNVRQLKNAIERMSVLAKGDVLTPDLLPADPTSPRGSAAEDLMCLPFKEAVAGFRRRMIETVLVRSGGNQTKAAEALGLQRTYLNQLIKELGIS